MVNRSEDKPSQEVVAEVAVEVLESSRKDRDVDEIRAQFRPLLVNEPQNDWCNGTDYKSVELFGGSKRHGCEGWKRWTYHRRIHGIVKEEFGSDQAERDTLIVERNHGLSLCKIIASNDVSVRYHEAYILTVHWWLGSLAAPDRTSALVLHTQRTREDDG